MRLTEDAARGDVAAFEEIARRYEGVMTAYVARCVPNRADVCEIVQDALMDAFRHIDRFDASRRLGPWLRGICRNRVRKFYRDVATRRGVYLSMTDRAVAGETERFVAAAKGRASGSAVVDTVLQCLREMSAGCQWLLDLRYLDDLPVKEVAAISGRSCGCVSQTLLRARKNLRSRVLRRLAVG